MKTEYLQAAYAVSVTSIILGLVLIFSSVSRGQSIASSEIQRNDGMMDTAQYNMIYKAGINQFLVLGGLFAGSGLLIAILVSFALLLRSTPIVEEDVHV